MSKRLTFVMLLVLVLAAASVGYGDVVKTKDGKELEGKVTGQTKDYVRLRTGYGELTIPRADIESITISTTTVHLKDGRRLQGTITEESSERVVLRTRYGELKIPRSDIEKFEKPREYLRASRAEPRTAQKLSQKDRAKLHKEGTELLKLKKYDEAVAVYEKIVAAGPGSYYVSAHYSLACAYSLKGERDTALDYLEKAIEEGYVAIHEMVRDTRLDNIRSEPRFHAIVAREEEIRRRGAEKRLARIEKRKDPGDILEIDHERKIIWVTTRTRACLEEIKRELNTYADAQHETLFEHRRSYYILAIVTHGRGGYYSHQRKELAVPHEGLHLMHEFTHSLHHADADARGQNHPIWVSEGFATLFETFTLIDGTPTPMPNFRLGTMRGILGTDRYVPWEKLFKFTQREFERNIGHINYAMARYIMYYFWHKGKLKHWYETYCANFDRDKTGKLAVEKTFGKPLAEVEEDFKRWVPNAPEGVGRTPPGGPYLGVTFVSFGGTAAGIKIDMVVSGSPADEAGMKAGDYITEFAGKKYTNIDMFRKAIRRQKIGEPVKIKVLRGDKMIELEVKLQPRE